MDVVQSIIENIYTDPDTRTLANDELGSGEISIYGKRVLTMAKYAGKGWFAILLSGEITAATKIPAYILDALMFAKEDYSDLLLVDIIKYRVEIHNTISPGLYDFSNINNLLDKMILGEKVDLNKVRDELSVISNDQIYSLVEKLIKEPECV